MMKRRTPWVAALVFLLAFVLASCGGAQGGGGAQQGGGSGRSQYTTAGKKAPTAQKKAPTGGEASGRVTKTVAIKESEFELSPSSVTLSKPGTYAFKAENKGSAQHSLEIEGEGVKSKGGELGEAKLEPYLDPGQSGVLTLTFQKPGTYEMYCPVIGHRVAGMKGSVVVK
jgi:uncharacterized cupredoxin-like copper-binding protein/predicted small secreted protein